MYEFGDRDESWPPVVLAGRVGQGSLAGWLVQVRADPAGEGWHLFLTAPNETVPTYDAFADEWADVFELGDAYHVSWDVET